MGKLHMYSTNHGNCSSRRCEISESIYIWSKTLRPKSEAKNGGIGDLH